MKKIIKRKDRFTSLLLAVTLFMSLIANEGLVANAESVSSVYADSYAEGISSLDESKDTIEEYEIVEERTKYSTTYQLANGEKRIVFYGEDVRYEDENGKLVDYDSSLCNISSAKTKQLEGYVLENKKGDIKNYLPNQLSETKPIILSKGKHLIKLTPMLQEKMPKNEFYNTKLNSVETVTETVTDIYDDTKEAVTTAVYKEENNEYTLEYVSNNNGIKENIVLNKAPSTNVWAFELELQGLTAKKDDCSEGISFYEKGTDTIVGGIETPFMNDATGEAYSENITYDISQKDGQADKYILTMTVDKEYLYSKQIVYPVTIDPTISLSGGTSIYDAYVTSGTTYGDMNFYSSSVTAMAVGRSKQGVSRTYLQFPELEKKLKGYSISSAKLAVYETGSNKGANVQAFCVKESWNKSSITWNKRAAYAGGAISSFTSTGVNGKGSTLDLTSYVRNVANGTNEDYGIVLKVQDETAASGIFTKFYGSRNATTSKRPKLTVVYYEKPTTPESVSVASAYIKKGEALKVNWAGINSVSLKNVQYKITTYDEVNKVNTGTYINYTTLATTADGTKSIAASKDWAEGCYRIYIRGLDNYGVAGASKSVAFRIDGTSPQLSSCSISPATSGTSYGKVVPSISWKGASDKYFSRVEYSVNGGAYRSLGTSETGSIKLLSSFFTSAGKYTIKVRAVDKAGNLSKEYTFNYYYDAAVPVISSFAMLPSGVGNTANPTLSWIVKEDTLKEISYSVNNGDYKSITPASLNGKFTVPSGIITTEGTYTFKIKAVDKAGNTKTSAELKYEYDSTVPSISGISVFPETSEEKYSNSSTPVLFWSGLESEDTRYLEYVIYYNEEVVRQGKVNDSITENGSIGLESDILTESGAYKIELWAVDNANNKSQSYEAYYYYDGEGPVVEGIRLNKGEKISVELENIKEDKSEIEQTAYYTIAQSDVTDVAEHTEEADLVFDQEGNAVFDITRDVKALEEGIYKVWVFLKDNAGNKSEVQSCAYFNLDKAVYDGSINLSVSYDQTLDKVVLSLNNSEAVETELYVRYGEGDFVNVISTENVTELTLTTEHINTTADYRVLFRYEDGTASLSNVVTLERVEEEDGDIFELTTQDSDEDGIIDAYEIWDLNSDPNSIDSDKDGFPDYYEVFQLGTSPAVYTQDRDSDKDGLTDLEEFKLGTNPFLSDSNFNGISDKDDKGNLSADKANNNSVEYTTEVKQGLYDTVKTEKNNDGSTTSYLTNIYTGTIKQIKSSDSVTAYYYDSKENNTAVVGCFNGEYRANTYVYNDNDKLSYVTHNGFGYNMSYDENDNLTCVSIGERNLLSYEYKKFEDDVYQAESLSFGNGDKYEYKYNSEGKINQIYIQGELAYSLSYDSEGNISKEIDHKNNITHSYKYDDENNIVEIKGSNGFTIAYLVTDAKESVEDGRTISSSSHSTTYNKDGITRKIYTLLEEDTITKVESQTTVLINGDTLEYVVNGNTNDITTTVNGADGKVALALSVSEMENGSREIRNHNGDTIMYNYDKNSNITSIIENGVETVSYEYDSLNQLRRENNTIANKTVVYSYDKGGNLQTIKEYNYTKNSVLGEPRKVNTYEYNDKLWKDLLTSYNGQEISYDDGGNPLSYRDGMSFTWTSGRRLESVSKDSDFISYKYNSDGVRTKKVVNGKETNYTLDGNNIIIEENEDNTIWYIYDGNGYITGFELNGTSYYYEKNLQGDIISIYNNSGEEVAGYQYDTWGAILAITGDKEIAEINPYRYRGYYYDNETGLYYLQSRYYDYETGRFLNADDVNNLGVSGTLLSYNLFAYCENNPVSNTDPSGCVTLTAAVLIGMGIGMAVGAAVGAYYSKKKFNVVKWKYIVGGALVGAAAGAGVGYGIGALAGASGSTTLALQANKLAKNVSKLIYSDTIKNYDRAYYKSRILVREIIKAGTPVYDQGRKNVLKWVVPGTYRKTAGVWELVIKTDKNMIVHFLFNSKPK